jgi:UDP-N-acetylmuramoyl-tripeptide--D-alanyl-D-alanine ligase
MSVGAALDDLAASADDAGPSRRVAVLGDMLELGPAGSGFHAELGQHAAAAGVDLLVTVGPLAAAIADAFDGEVRAVADAADAARLVPTLLRRGDTVLVKGSRAVGLEVVCDAIRAPTVVRQ